MAYEPYVTTEEYRERFEVDQDLEDAELYKSLVMASRHIDSLTFNRIVGKRDRMTEFQSEIIKEVCGLQAQFEMENEDEINTILSSYSINGVSAQFGSSWNVFTDKGVAMKRDVYALLCQTGLCCQLAR